MWMAASGETTPIGPSLMNRAATPCWRPNCSTYHFIAFSSPKSSRITGCSMRDSVRMRSSVCCTMPRTSSRSARRRAVGGQPPLHASEQHPDRRQQLAELVVQLAREALLQVLLHPHHLPRQAPELRREPAHVLERAAIGGDAIEPRDAHDEQQRAHQDEDLALHPPVNRLVSLRRVFLHPVVEHEELRHHAHEFLVLRGGARPERRRGGVFVTGRGLCESGIDVRPEARKGRHEPRLLRRRDARRAPATVPTGSPARDRP